MPRSYSGLKTVFGYCTSCGDWGELAEGIKPKCLICLDVEAFNRNSLDEYMLCGHHVSWMSTTDEGTCYCIASEDRAWAEAHGFGKADETPETETPSLSHAN